jgi:hypothetical protein
MHQSVLQVGLIWFSRTPFDVMPMTFDSDVHNIIISIGQSMNKCNEKMVKQQAHIMQQSFQKVKHVLVSKGASVASA